MLDIVSVICLYVMPNKIVIITVIVAICDDLLLIDTVRAGDRRAYSLYLQNKHVLQSTLQQKSEQSRLGMYGPHLKGRVSK